MFGKPLKNDFKNLKLDRFSVSDINYFITAIKDPSIHKLLYYYHTYSQEQGIEWYNKNTNNNDIYIWGVYYNEKLMGYCRLYDINYIIRNAKIGLRLLDKENFGKGIGTECLKLISEYGFNELNLECLYYETSTENIPSQKCALKNNYIHCGLIPYTHRIDGKYYSSWIAYKIKKHPKQ